MTSFRNVSVPRGFSQSLFFHQEKISYRLASLSPTETHSAKTLCHCTLNECYNVSQIKYYVYNDLDQTITDGTYLGSENVIVFEVGPGRIYFTQFWVTYTDLLQDNPKCTEQMYFGFLITDRSLRKALRKSRNKEAAKCNDLIKCRALELPLPYMGQTITFPNYRILHPRFQLNQPNQWPNTWTENASVAETSRNDQIDPSIQKESDTWSCGGTRSSKSDGQSHGEYVYRLIDDVLTDDEQTTPGSPLYVSTRSPGSKHGSNHEASDEYEIIV